MVFVLGQRSRKSRWNPFVSSYKEKEIKVQRSGLLEATYDKTLCEELIAYCSKEHQDENPRFIAGVNHLLLRKAGMRSSLKNFAMLSGGGLKEQMDELYRNWIVPRSGFDPNDPFVDVNISSEQRKKLEKRWSMITSARAVDTLVEARQEIVAIMATNIIQRGHHQKFSRRLVKTLQLTDSPTDTDVMKRLKAQGPNLMIEHLGGRWVPPEEWK